VADRSAGASEVQSGREAAPAARPERRRDRSAGHRRSLGARREAKGQARGAAKGRLKGVVVSGEKASRRSGAMPAKRCRPRARP